MSEDDDTRRAYQMTIAHVIYNRGLGITLDTCEAIAEEVLRAVEALDLVDVSTGSKTA